jgi:hypothetical protein
MMVVVMFKDSVGLVAAGLPVAARPTCATMDLSIAVSSHVQVTKVAKVQLSIRTTLGSRAAAQDLHTRAAMAAMQNQSGLAAKVVGTI